MERETAGCLFLDKNTITSINLLLSLNYLDFIINNNTTAYSILLYIQGSQGILEVLMNEQGMKKLTWYLVTGFFLEILMQTEFHSLATTSGQILFIYFLCRKKRCHEITNNVYFDLEIGALQY